MQYIFSKDQLMRLAAEFVADLHGVKRGTDVMVRIDLEGEAEFLTVDDGKEADDAIDQKLYVK